MMDTFTKLFVCVCMCVVAWLKLHMHIVNGCVTHMYNVALPSNVAKYDAERSSLKECMISRL